MESVEILSFAGIYPRSHFRTFTLRFSGWSCGCDAIVLSEQLFYDLTLGRLVLASEKQ